MKLTLVLVGLLLALVAWVRFAKDDPTVWHVDPLTVVKHKNPNQFLLLPDGERRQSPVFDMPAADLAETFQKVALGADRVAKLATSEDGLWCTYVQRSNLMRYPDYISVRFIELADGKSTLAVYSRSRFGRKDFGVNKARVKAWIGAMGKPVL